MIKKMIMSVIAPMFLILSLQVSAGDSLGKNYGKVYINEASVSELSDQLKGVGDRIAREIVNYREDHGSFKSFEDLDKVKFVGTKLIEKNRNNISFDSKK